MRKIPFNSVSILDEEVQNFKHLLSDYDLFRKKHYSQLCLQQLKEYYPHSDLFLTHSATGALEMIALLMDIKEGDEVIMPSYTFVSTANAFVSRGARPVFIDIEPNSLSIDETLIESAITVKTKAIVVVHYAGHTGQLSRIKEICDQHQIYLIEDAAMGFGGKYENIALGAYGDFGVVSFDITKQISAIQGGLLIVNNRKYNPRTNHLYHIGTNRDSFMKKTIPYYEWVDKGSKFQMNELNALVLHENLKHAQEILRYRNELSKRYFEALKPLREIGQLKMVELEKLENNFHEFYIILKSKKEREDLSDFLGQYGVEALFHYIPLHTAPFGQEKSLYFGGTHTQEISDTLLRLPLHAKMSLEDADYVCEKIKNYFDAEK